MNIDSLKIQNFGPFENFSVKFNPSGLNFILGNNGTGKTQLIGALYYLIAGKKAININRKNKDTSIVEVKIVNDKNIYTIKRKFSDTSSLTFSSKNIDNNKEIHFSINDKEALKEIKLIVPHYNLDFNPFIFFEDLSDKKVKLNIDDFNIIDKIIKKNNSWNKIKNNIKSNLSTHNDGINTYSQGTKILIIYLAFLIEYIKLKKNQPIIIDSGFSRLNREDVEFLLKILQYIGKTNQIIILDHLGSFNTPILQKNIIAKLGHYSSFTQRKISFNYKKKQYLIDINKNANTKITFRYIEGKVFEKEENRFNEFKEISGKPINNIKENCLKYVIGYLNELTPKEGTIYWGINDSTRKIVGVELSYQDKDEIQLFITDQIKLITPHCFYDNYYVNFKTIYNEKNNVIKDLYIIELSIKPIKSDFLYSYNNKCYIRMDGSTHRLNALEIQEIVLQRNKNKINSR